MKFKRAVKTFISLGVIFTLAAGTVSVFAKEPDTTEECEEETEDNEAERDNETKPVAGDREKDAAEEETKEESEGEDTSGSESEEDEKTEEKEAVDKGEEKDDKNKDNKQQPDKEDSPAQDKTKNSIGQKAEAGDKTSSKKAEGTAAKETYPVGIAKESVNAKDTACDKIIDGTTKAEEATGSDTVFIRQEADTACDKTKSAPFSIGPVVGTVVDLSTPAEAVTEVSAEELTGMYKDGVYAALRDAGMSHNGASSVMAAMDASSGFEAAGSLLSWTGQWEDALNEYSEDPSSLYAYQIAFFIDSIENPGIAGAFDDMKAVLMSDNAAVATDVWYFMHTYMDAINPDSDINIQEVYRLADEYADRYEEVKNSYGDLVSVFDMLESAGGQAVVDYACGFIGNPYVWGGVSLTNGADCSGFIQSVYAHFGVSLPHYSGALRSVGYEVDPGEMLPGDIVCYDGHCAIYIGNGKIVHASNSKPYPVGGIKISDDYGYRTVLAIRRIVEPEASGVEPVTLTDPVL